MHDFWWLCARQFLVDRDQQPCCLVVEAGVCPCEVDVAWRHRRGPRPWRALLASADLVLAPSAAAVAVLAANGVAPGRLAVDENGLPAAGARPGRRPAAGHDPAATRRGPALRLHRRAEPHEGRRRAARRRRAPGRHRPAGGSAPTGSASTSTSRAAPVDGLPVDVLDPFAPDELGRRARRPRRARAAVGHARDALASPPARRCRPGCRWCAPTPSAPRRSSRHGVNGLVVPAADAAALAAALAPAGASDRDLLDRLRARGRRPGRRPHHRRPGRRARAALRRAARRPRRRHPAAAESPVVARCCSCAASRARRCATGPGCRPRPWPWSGVTQRGAPLPRPRAARAGRAGRRRRLLPGAGHRAGARADRRASTAPASPAPSTSTTSSSTPSVRDEIPALRLLPARRGRALARRASNRYRTTLEACDAYIGSTDDAGRPRRRADRPARPPLRQRRRPAAGPPGRPRAAAARAGPGRCGSATSAAPPPTTRTGSSSSRPSSRCSTATPTSSCGWAATSPTAPRSTASAPGCVRLPFLAVARAAGRAARPRRQPVAARPGQPLQRGQERHQVARGGAVRHPDRGQPHRTVPRGHRRRAHRAAGRRRRRRGSPPSTACSATRPSGPASATWLAAGPCSSGPRPARASATGPSSTRSPPGRPTDRRSAWAPVALDEPPEPVTLEPYREAEPTPPSRRRRRRRRGEHPPPEPAPRGASTGSPGSPAAGWRACAPTASPAPPARP